MNPVFDFNRWLLLIGKHWNENKKKYLLGIVSIGCLLIIWYSFLILVNRPLGLRQDVQIVTFYVGLFLVGCLYASLFFSEMADAPKGIHYVLTPASTAEKLLTALLYAVVLFFLCYTVVFYAVDVIMVKVANSVAHKYAEQFHTGSPQTEKVVNVFTGVESGNKVLLYLNLIYLVAQAAFLLGSVYFARYSFIKTAIAILVIFLFFVFYLQTVTDWILPKGRFSETMMHYVVSNGQQRQMVQLPDYIVDTCSFLFKYAFAPLFWVTAYFRLKEKEV